MNKHKRNLIVIFLLASILFVGCTSGCVATETDDWFYILNMNTTMWNLLH